MPSTTGTGADAPASQPIVSEHDDKLPMLAVSLLKPVDSLEGAEWTRGRDPISKKEDQPRNWIVYPRPNSVTVRLPSGGSITHYSKATFFMQRSGVVEAVELMPFPSHVPLQKAIPELENLLKQWGAEPNDRAKNNIENWKTHGNVRPDPFLVDYRGRASIPGEDRATVFFQIRPSRESGWYLIVQVGLTMEERRKLRNIPTTHPTTADTNGQR